MGDRLQVDEETGLPVLKSKFRNDRCTRLAAHSAALPHISVGIYFCEHTRSLHVQGGPERGLALPASSTERRGGCEVRV